MTFSDFLSKWNGRYCEIAGSLDAKFQCVDLANLYIRDVLELSIIEWTNAVDFPIEADLTKYNYILNTPTNIPREGDLIIWKPSPGHIAIFIEGNVDTFKSFDQNFPIGSPCHVQNHTYVNIIGWLRCKQPPQVTTEALTQCQIQLADEIRKKNDNYNWGLELSNEVDGLKSQIQHYTGYESQLATTLNCEVDEAKILGEITKLIGSGDQLRQALADNQILKLSEAALQTEKAQLTTKADNCFLQNNAVSDELQKAPDNIIKLSRKLEE